MKITEANARELRDVVFGPNSACYECLDIADVLQRVEDCPDLPSWFRIQLDVEDITMGRMGIGHRESSDAMNGYRQRFDTYLQRHAR